jgi:hypothetical protein
MIATKFKNIRKQNPESILYSRQYWECSRCTFFLVYVVYWCTFSVVVNRVVNCVMPLRVKGTRLPDLPISRDPQRSTPDDAGTSGTGTRHRGNAVGQREKGGRAHEKEVGVYGCP